ncbi:MAG TPA: AraC family transcriptional regulator [Capsulimonadaceae bacterium]|jgi:AraC-like DNA-binding protein
MPDNQVKIIVNDEIEAKPGRISRAALVTGSRGIGLSSMRVLGGYGIVYIVDGAGSFRDGAGTSKLVTAGDCLVLFPDVPHAYGPTRGARWSELYVTFDGPVFDLWREMGVLDETRPIRRLAPVTIWQRRIETLLTVNDRLQPIPASVTVARFLALLTEMLAAGATEQADNLENRWHSRALHKLGSELGSDLSIQDVAADVGMSYELFRKKFVAETGISPARYRTKKRVVAAAEILYRTNMPLKQIAEHLGFSNEFNLSRCFKQLTGYSPREYRQRPFDLPAPEPPADGEES